MNMVDIIFHIAIGITDKFGYIGILLVMLLDYSCIPIPTEVIIPLIGCGVAEGEYGFLYSILFASIGGTIGALISYTIGNYMYLSLQELKELIKFSIPFFQQWELLYGQLQW